MGGRDVQKQSSTTVGIRQYTQCVENARLCKDTLSNATRHTCSKLHSLLHNQQDSCHMLHSGQLMLVSAGMLSHV